MKSILFIGVSLLIVNSTLFAGVKKEIDMKQFLGELKVIQKQISINKVPAKNIDNDIQNINKEIQYKNVVADSKNDVIILQKIKKSISFLDNYLILLNKKVNEEKHIYGDNYFKIEDVAYLKVNKKEVESIGEKIYKEKIKILEIKKLSKLLKSFRHFDQRVLLSSQITLILNDMKQLVNAAQNNYNNSIVVDSRNTKYNFCSLSKKCFGYKVINITPNEIILDF